MLLDVDSVFIMVSQASQLMLNDGMSPFSTPGGKSVLSTSSRSQRGGAQTRPADGEKQKQQIALKACLHPLQFSSSAAEKVSAMHLSIARLQLQQCEPDLLR